MFIFLQSNIDHLIRYIFYRVRAKLFVSKVVLNSFEHSNFFKKRAVYNSTPYSRVSDCHESIFTKTFGLENIFNAFSISLSLFSSSIFRCLILRVSQLTGKELSAVVISFCPE